MHDRVKKTQSKKTRRPTLSPLPPPLPFRLTPLILYTPPHLTPTNHDQYKFHLLTKCADIPRHFKQRKPKAGNLFNDPSMHLGQYKQGRSTGRGGKFPPSKNRPVPQHLHRLALLTASWCLFIWYFSLFFLFFLLFLPLLLSGSGLPRRVRPCKTNKGVVGAGEECRARTAQGSVHGGRELKNCRLYIFVVYLFIRHSQTVCSFVISVHIMGLI